MSAHRPYVPLGITQQGRVTPTKLCEAHLDRRQAERDAAAMSLPDLLLAKGSMSGPHTRTLPRRAMEALRSYLTIALQVLRRITTRKVSL